MTCKEPKFAKSPFLVDEPGNWHLKPGATEDIVKEFNEYMEAQKICVEAPKLDEAELEKILSELKKL